MHIKCALELIMSIGQSLGQRDRGRYSMSTCKSSGNDSNIDQLSGPVNKGPVFNHGVGYIHNIHGSSRREDRCTEGFVRHCNADHCLHCQLVGKSASMHFVMHLFENVLVIHILVEKECKGRRGRYSHFGRQFDTASNKRSRQRERN